MPKPSPLPHHNSLRQNTDALLSISTIHATPACLLRIAPAAVVHDGEFLLIQIPPAAATSPRELLKNLQRLHLHPEFVDLLLTVQAADIHWVLMDPAAPPLPGFHQFTTSWK